MLKKFKPWYKGLGKIGKISFWTVSGLLLGTVINASASTSNNIQEINKDTANVSRIDTNSPNKDDKSKTETKIVREKEVIKYSTSSVNDPNLTSGKTGIQTAGVNGEKTISYEVTTRDGKEISRVKKGEEITKSPINEVTTIGTYVAPPPKTTSSNCDPNYSGACVPIASDVDCAGGSGNGPAYVSGPVYVVGSDIYGLDRDGDGVGCQ